ncbi:hypothetical protein L1887_55057 [Cichorium endivia]|nr:hypothetical protein L1887_55057 [Cichorium endivia]
MIGIQRKLTSAKKRYAPHRVEEMNKGGEHDHRKVANPVCACRDRDGGGSRAQRVDLWTVQPGKRQDGPRKHGDEEVETHRGTLGVADGFRSGKTRHEDAFRVTHLEELSRGADEHASEVLGFAVGEKIAQSALFAGLFDGVANDACLELDLLLVGRLALEGKEDVLCFVVPAAGDEPARGFGEVERAHEEHSRKDDLECDWEAPLHAAGHVRQPKIEPVRHERSYHHAKSIKKDEEEKG